MYEPGSLVRIDLPGTYLHDELGRVESGPSLTHSICCVRLLNDRRYAFHVSQLIKKKEAGPGLEDDAPIPQPPEEEECDDATDEVNQALLAMAYWKQWSQLGSVFDDVLH